ncbi:hypothetical protein LPA44_12080 [Halobacterium sp. KA-4]|uniref:hypothetical protein n=1 Tax=Halobacterium sp. KA-4 TaxID=2896367 RepID=UPI001E375587|nr:hypothetical protein [Halobacterium sp. KA-4]
MGDSSSQSESADEGLPEKTAQSTEYPLINAAIATIPDMVMPRECVAYENAHQNRTQILKRFEWKAAELREDLNECPVNQHSTVSLVIVG